MVQLNMICTVTFELLVIIITCHIFHSQENVQMVSDEKRLIKELILNYSNRGKMGRPVLHHSDIVTIYYGISLIQILDLDEKNLVLKTNVWLHYAWNDIFLRWNESEYDNIKSVRVNIDDIWKPDIMLYNYADLRLEEKKKVMGTVSSNGDVYWNPQAIFLSSCAIDVKKFPLDVQRCYMKFGSWTYDGFKLDLQLYHGTPGFQLKNFKDSPEWNIQESTATKNKIIYPCCLEPYYDITFSIVIQRRVDFQSYILILPCILLSSLTLMLFWLPPESPAKLQLGVNIFVAFFVLLLMLAESTPPSASTIPLIGYFYCANIILITMSSLMSVVVVHMYFHGPGSRVPRAFRQLMLDFFAKVFFMEDLLMDPKEFLDRQNSIPFKRYAHDCPSTGKFPNVNTAEASSLQNTAKASSLQNTAKASSLQNTAKASSLQNTAEASSLQNTAKASSLQNTAKASSLQNTAEASSLQNTAEASSLQNNTDVDFLEICLPDSSKPASKSHEVQQAKIILRGQMLQLEADLEEIKKSLKRIIFIFEEKAHKEYLAREWKVVARVLDRLFFFTNIIIIIVMSLIMFVSET